MSEEETIVDGMREAKTLHEFGIFAGRFVAWFGLIPNITTVGDKIIASLPEEVDFDQFWLKPSQYNQFFIYIKNLPQNLSNESDTKTYKVSTTEEQKRT